MDPTLEGVFDKVPAVRPSADEMAREHSEI
jgi:hypothetical protein